MDEVELAVLLASDLDRHFGQLVMLYEARLYAFMVRQTGHAQEAEDIVQEALMQAYFALARYTPQQRSAIALRPWLYKIMLNVFYGRLRKGQLFAVALDLSEDGPHLTIEEDLNLRPEVILEKREAQRELEALLNQLPERYRIVLNLYYFADLGYQEIADLLNVPLGSIKSLLHRGIQRLRKALELSQGKEQESHATGER
ncbi:MAG TPA: RNA polymerase sigma factor [Ktedonobacteraceae bacterium]